MKPTIKDARIAGLLYLILVLSGLLSLMYVPSQLMNWDSASETYNNILSNQGLFKIGILGDLVLSLTFIFLSLALYKLLKGVHKNVAVIMVILVLISIPISFINIVHKLDVLSLLDASNLAQTISLDQQHLDVMSLFESHNNGIMVLIIFWGLWLLPFGYLVFKSGFIPKFFGVLLILGCFGYLTDFFGHFFFPNSYGDTVIPGIAALPHAMGEIGICLWLLIFGINKSSK